MNLPKLKISSFILKKHMKTLSNMLLHSFDTYLAQCTFKNSLLKDLRSTEWNADADYVLHSSPFQAITGKYIIQLKTAGMGWLKKRLFAKKQRALLNPPKPKEEEKKPEIIDPSQQPPTKNNESAGPLPEEQKSVADAAANEALLKEEKPVEQNLVEVKAVNQAKN